MKLPEMTSRSGLRPSVQTAFGGLNHNLSAEERFALEQEIPAGRFGTPEEVAACVRLLFHAPSYLTGQIIGVDGGWG